MRYYIIDNQGTVHGEASTKAKAEALMRDIFTDREIEENEIEVI